MNKEALMEPAIRIKKSTNVRSGIERVAQAVLRGLSAVAPPLAGAVAERLFFTAPRFPAPAAERAALEKAIPFWFPVEGKRVRAWWWSGGPEIVMLIHGWGGRGGQLHRFVAPLKRAGYAVLAFDMPGHGQSEGRTSSIFDFAAAIRAASESGPIAGVIAHSLGAAAVAVALERGAQLGRLVFIGSPSKIEDGTRKFAERMGLGDAAHASLARRIERRYGITLKETSVVEGAPRMTAPLLVIHDQNDREVPSSSGAEIAAAWPGARFVATNGLGHQRILRDPEVVARAVEFVSGVAQKPGERCPHRELETWDDDGLLCPTCTIERELFDREARLAAA
jgi:pimeloyl-ACP methyl ester carboxylesterase